MLWNPVLAVFFCVLEFFAGALIGTGAAVLVFRRRFRPSLVLRAAVGAGLAFLIFATIGGWASAHEGFHNGSPVDVGSSGENLWLRNRIAEHQAAVCVAASVAAGLLAGLRFRGPKRLGNRG
jgi:hypothetical protein